MGSRERVSRIRRCGKPSSASVPSPIPTASSLHEPWAVAARSRLDGIDVDTLLALWTPCSAVPDFLTPPPVSSRPQFDEELRRVRATPPEQIRRDLQVTYEDSLPPGLESLYRRPGSGIDKLVRLVGAYWERALADHWPRLRLVLEGDVVYRTRALAAGGAMAVFDDLHERVAWESGDVVIGAPEAAEAADDHRVEIDDRGLLLMPSAFIWPFVATMFREPAEPAVVYPSRGIGTLWQAEPRSARRRSRRSSGGPAQGCSRCSTPRSRRARWRSAPG